MAQRQYIYCYNTAFKLSLIEYAKEHGKRAVQYNFWQANGKKKQKYIQVPWKLLFFLIWCTKITSFKPPNVQLILQASKYCISVNIYADFHEGFYINPLLAVSTLYHWFQVLHKVQLHNYVQRSSQSARLYKHWELSLDILHRHSQIKQY